MTKITSKISRQFISHRFALIIGYGLTGKSFVSYCKKNRIKYFIFSDKKEEILNSKEKDNFFHDTKFNWKKISMVLVSPSVNTVFNPHFLITIAKKKKIKILSDFDLFYLELQKRKLAKKPKIISVTGTNGKSTTISLIYFLYKKLKLNVKLAGNIGKPILYELNNKNLADYYIIEASSFQIENSSKIKYDFGILLNISKDHIEYHGSFENYFNSKIKLLNCSKKIAIKKDILDNNLIVHSKTNNNFLYKKKINMIYRNHDNSIENNDLSITNNNFKINHIFSYIFNKNNQKTIIDIMNKKKSITFLETFTNLQGFYNIENILFAISSLECAFSNKVFNFIDKNLYKIIKIIKKFKTLEHRKESFLKIQTKNNIIECINDSKATNLDAVSLTLDSIVNKKICLIMGGIPKDLTVKDLDINLLKNVHGVFLIGQATDLFYSEFKEIKQSLVDKKDFQNSLIEVRKSYNLKQATKEAFVFATANNCDIILLSPMCASFDQFKDYQDRGKIFKEICKNLT